MADVRPAPDVVAQRVADELVLVHLETNRIFALNSSAARFWELLAAGHDREEIVRIMTSEFDVEREHLRREIDEIVSSLAAERLLGAGDDV